MTDHIKTLLAEYLVLCRAMSAGEYNGDDDYRELSAQRTWTHNELIRLLGPDFDRPFDMQAYARSVLG